MSKELAYVAGFFDGDGCVCVQNEIQKDFRIARITASIANTNVEIIKYLKKRFGGYVKIRELPSGKTLGTWMLSCKAAVEFLEQIMPFMRIKKEQAELACKLYAISNRRNRTLSRNKKGQFNPISQADRKEMNRLRQKIKELKM